jgi:riboflavin kinase/FMN adenylyltransferase
VNIFGFNKEIYGESLTVNFHKLIRHDAKFSDLKELKKQMDADQEQALTVLKQI